MSKSSSGRRSEAVRSSVYETDLLQAYLEEWGRNPSHATTIQALVQKRQPKHTNELTWLGDEPGLPKEAMEKIGKRFVATNSHVVRQVVSKDGTTIKLLLQLHDGLQVETVILRYEPEKGRNAAAPDRKRVGMPRSTLCVSSQIGCQMACKFCATGKMGIKGDLTQGEILEQLYHASQITQIRNVVFMGMGEPLNNYKNVVSASKQMLGRKVFDVRRLTISTVGIPAKIKLLPHDLPGCHLALSLHAPSQEKRLQIVPSTRAFPLHKLMEAVHQYLQSARHPTVFVEYILLEGINDGIEDARNLGLLLHNIRVTVNLIPYNPAFASGEDTFSAPSEGGVLAFQRCLRDEFGIRTTVRQEMGQDIQGACGQLANKKMMDIEELASGLPPTREGKTSMVGLLAGIRRSLNL
eukprot:scaffold662_cov364-Pavlova_lutheri.AAC.51